MLIENSQILIENCRFNQIGLLSESESDWSFNCRPVSMSDFELDGPNQFGRPNLLILLMTRKKLKPISQEQ